MEDQTQVLDIKKLKHKTVSVPLTIYSLDEIFRAAYYLTDVAYMIINDKKTDEENVEVIIIPKKDSDDLDRIVLEFYNKILIAHEELRAIKRSESVRKLLTSGVLLSIGKEISGKPSPGRTPPSVQKPGNSHAGQ